MIIALTPSNAWYQIWLMHDAGSEKSCPGTESRCGSHQSYTLTLLSVALGRVLLLLVTDDMAVGLQLRHCPTC